VNHHGTSGRRMLAATVLLLSLVVFRHAGPPVPGGACEGAGDLALDPGFVRIQVVANSDSAFDQQVKSLVRDAIRSRLGEEAARFESAQQAMDRAEEVLPELRREVGLLLAETGCPYGCSLATGELPFPAKSYGGVIVPPGMYPALRVTLGEGKGSNWWCVLFPPLCFVDVGGSVAVFGEGEVGPDGPAGVPEGAGDTQRVGEVVGALRGSDLNPLSPRPRLRSWLVEKLRSSEWLRWLFGGDPVPEGSPAIER